MLLWFFSILKRFRLRVASGDHFLSSEPSLYFLPHEICYALPIQPEIESIGRWDTAHQNSSPRVPPGWCSLSVSVEPTSRWVTQALFLLPSQGYADDITIVKSHKDPAIAAHNLQIFCDTVVKWLASRKLFVNPLQPFPTFSLANCQSDRTSKFS